ncbi:MAG: hypothetical protein WC450_02315 [Candidatus Omnitrophota bacterium]|jgi:hypothetical protein
MKTRTGIRIKGERGNKEVRNAVILFAKWLRKNYEFPVRVPVYLLPSATFTTMDGEEVVASFRWFGKHDEPHIRLATGDYLDLCKKFGKEGAIESILLSFARQIVRYQNWCKTGKCTDHGVKSKSYKMVDEYFEN